MNSTRMLLPGPRCGEVTVPSSKSAVHRLLIAAALGEEPVTVKLRGLSNDILATAACLQAMGAAVNCSSERISVRPLDRSAVQSDRIMLPCGESGSTLRFLLPILGACGFSGCFQMEGRLPARPMEAFEQELHRHGMAIEREGSRLCCSGRLTPGDYRLPGNISSQYFSGLLFALPLLEGNSRLTAEGSLESGAYIRMTEETLLSAGAELRKTEAGWIVPGGQRFRLPAALSAEGDWSNAAFFLCLGALSDKGVRVRGLCMDSVQGDRAVVSTLEAFGAVISSNADCITVRKGRGSAFTLDASGIPDLVPVLSVLACAAEGESRITNAARLRLKESDRLRSTAQLISDLGGSVTELPDGLIIRGSGRLCGGTVDSCHDHRIAMSAAVAAAVCTDAVYVQDPDCVEKSYPDFWKDLKALSEN